VHKREAWDIGPPGPEFWRIVRRVLRQGAKLVVFSDDRIHHTLASNIEAAGFEVEGMCVWVFATGKPRTRTQPRPAVVPIIVARAPGRPLVTDLGEARIPWRDDKDRDRAARANTLSTARRRIYADDLDRNKIYTPDVRGRWPSNVLAEDDVLGHHQHIFQIPCVRDSAGHPAAKPVKLLAQLVRLYSPPGGLVLDPFAGGGSTGVAAMATGRRALLIERDPDFHEMARKNLSKAHRGDYRTDEIPAHFEDMTDLSASVRNCINTSDNEHLRATPERATLLEPDGLLTSRDMAKRLGISSRTLRRRVREEGWPCVRVGPKALRFDPEKVMAAISKK
jgi:excisionase family DNA binding protein